MRTTIKVDAQAVLLQEQATNCFLTPHHLTKNKNTGSKSLTILPASSFRSGSMNEKSGNEVEMH